jgi:hypothetical protein
MWKSMPLLILRVRVDEAVGQASDHGKLTPGLWVEIGVAGAAIDCDKSEAEIRKPRGIICTAGDISCDIDHGVVNAMVPFERALVEHVGKSRSSVGRVA